ncbi:MAG: preprotein translocase subunit SecE [Candidatus Cloacimonetes bacterium]|nr:preprotein translocase subunit SecE [Candidatus Cloacimonadota bacterium]
MQGVKSFLDEVWREVHPTKGRVVWPDREKIIRSTWVVVTMSVICSLFIWLVDTGFNRVISGFLFE